MKEQEMATEEDKQEEHAEGEPTEDGQAQQQGPGYSGENAAADKRHHEDSEVAETEEPEAAQPERDE